MSKAALQKLFGALFLFYPIVIFLLVKNFSVADASLFLSLFLAVRLLLFRGNRGVSNNPNSNFDKMTEYVLWPILVYNLINLYFKNELAIRVYPFLMSLCFFSLFLRSVLTRNPLVEQFARMYEKDLSSEKLKYIWKLNYVWTFWLFVNTGLALYTLIWTSLESWMFYNNVIFYIVSGALIVADILYRKFILSYHHV